MNDSINTFKVAEKGLRVSIITYILISIAKLIIGTIANSSALTADGLNNFTDVISSIALLIGIRIARKPADKNHVYGHLRAETIATLVASLIMMVLGASVVFDGGRNVINLEVTSPSILAAFTALGSSFILYFVYRYNRRIAKQVNSKGLMASSKDNLADSMVSLGSAIGIFATRLGFPVFDPIIAILIGLLIVKTGWEIFRDSIHHLTDGFDPEELDKINEVIKQIEPVEDVSDIKGRFHGNKIFLEITIKLNPYLSIDEGHDITEDIESILKKEFDISYVITHVEPYYDNTI
ncbi:cation diffusion facilitator family transporter [Haloplasma contractile]|uniref:Co-Zn-Cd cation transporter protein n=1 Tax=Haloplasma contractile SSD-17B TaxID=1033810 RepID=F7PW48_9MOLU|nr:cation diffusion facilitator family transporter [Haloplasma contractile]ERJ12648.1 putative Co-Zn-Cd cation transporter protein [Haloplasma contractile SSD-17B]